MRKETKRKRWKEMQSKDERARRKALHAVDATPLHNDAIGGVDVDVDVLVLRVDHHALGVALCVRFARVAVAVAAAAVGRLARRLRHGLEDDAQPPRHLAAPDKVGRFGAHLEVAGDGQVDVNVAPDGQGGRGLAGGEAVVDGRVLLLLLRVRVLVLCVIV